MHRRTARGNRLGLLLSGIVLVAGGVLLLLAHLGRLGSSTGRLYPPDVRRFVRDNDTWLWPVVAAVAILLGLVLLRWLLVQPRVDRLRRLVVDTDRHADTEPGAGRTRLVAAALTDAIEGDVTALRGVRGASATVTGYPDLPQLWLSVTTDADADLAAIRRTVVDQIVADARTCLDLPHLQTYLRLQVSRRDGGSDLHRAPSAPVAAAPVPSAPTLTKELA